MDQNLDKSSLITEQIFPGKNEVRNSRVKKPRIA